MTIRKAEQYCLFSVRINDDAELKALKQELLKDDSARNTTKAYRQCWKIFTPWCQDRGFERLPASPEVVGSFLSWMREKREPHYGVKTVELALSAIRRYHRDAGLPVPVDAEVLALMRSMRKRAAQDGYRKETAGKNNLTVDQLKTICGSFGDDPIDIRDRAIILVGFASGLRRSNLSAITTDQLHYVSGSVRVWVPISKTDQVGKGRNVWLRPGNDPKLCPVRALEDWKAFRLRYCGHFRGPLFNRFTWNTHEMMNEAIGGKAICLVLKRRLQRCGVDPRDYGAHSMRSGMITAADEAGASVRSIMDQSGHATLEAFMRYIKSKPGANPLAGVL